MQASQNEKKSLWLELLDSVLLSFLILWLVLLDILYIVYKHMKKIIYPIFATLISIRYSFAQEAPGIWWDGLPWDVNSELWVSGNYDNSPFEEFANVFASELIKFVAAVAVIALMLSWIMLIISGWQEEKFKKAKTWFIWSLIWVLVSLSAWFLISFLNNLSIW